MDPLADLRRNNYKARNQFKPEEVRRRRETAQVEIRKQKKEENLAKRRNFNVESLPADSDDEDSGYPVDAQVYIKILGSDLLLLLLLSLKIEERRLILREKKESKMAKLFVVLYMHI